VSSASLPGLGAVAIGRNEGERLRACLESVREQVAACVYVDSGSTDQSIATARSLSIDVVELDLSVPFTAARARNAGFRRLLELMPAVEHVQFVDGDCVVAPRWLEAGKRALDADARVAVVCGRRRERHPDASVYNRL
jgi:glycosyltransferase involved in cell wall biosynthesis